MPDEKPPHVDATLDLRGLSCPGPLIGAKKLLDELAPGQVLLLLSDCPGTQADLFSWVKFTANEMARTERCADGGHAYYLRKGRTQHLAANAVLDLRGAVCPGPIVEAKRLLNAMGPGETLRLVSNCPGIRQDVADWVRATGLVLRASAEIGPGEFEFYLGKK